MSHISSRPFIPIGNFPSAKAAKEAAAAMSKDIYTPGTWIPCRAKNGEGQKIAIVRQS